MKDSASVLVTGGAGFLGQHVVGLLQAKADHVTEIRVLDIVPFENKLDYKHTKPLKIFVGSIGLTDEKILKEACHGVQSVIHIAGITDATMFPDNDKVYGVHIQGTLLTLLTALDTAGIQRFIFCSSDAVAIGNNDVTQGISENDPIPSKRLLEPYASSKLAGERVVLSANSKNFRSVCLRPLLMWGELHTSFVLLAQRIAFWTFGYLPTFNCGDVVQQNAYVGNVAWGFVCAETKLYNDFKKGDPISEMTDTVKSGGAKSELCSELRRRSNNTRNDSKLEDFKDIARDSELSSANVYYIADDTPPENIYKFQEPFLAASGCKLIKYPYPLIMMNIVFYIIYGVLLFLRLLGLKFNFPVGLGFLSYYRRSYIFSDAKAREELGYRPLYTPEVALERSLKYYKKFSRRVN